MRAVTTTRACAVLAVALAIAGLAFGPAAAQLVLPGAVQPTPAGATQVPKAARPKAAARPDGDKGERIKRGAAVAVPGVGTLAGKVLALNGGASQVVFTAADRSVVVTRLSLSGEKISSRDACRIEETVTPLPLTPLGRPNGLERLQLGFPACPVAFEVLDGAILVDRAQPACAFTEADCRVALAGLWGPAPAELGPDRVKSLERVRAAAESAVRSNYKALVASTKDRPSIMGFAREQAQFSSSREETCRDYADEGRHGFCAAKLTEARAAQLHDELAAALDAKAARKAARNAASKGK